MNVGVRGDGFALVATDTGGGTLLPDGTWATYEHGNRVRRLRDGSLVGLSGAETRAEAMFGFLAESQPASPSAAVAILANRVDVLRSLPASTPPAPGQVTLVGGGQDGDPWAAAIEFERDHITHSCSHCLGAFPFDITPEAQREAGGILATLAQETRLTLGEALVSVGRAFVAARRGSDLMTDDMQVGIRLALSPAGTISRIPARELAASHVSDAPSLLAAREDGGGLPATLPASNYLDFTATTTSPFLKHSALELLADGTATFAGTLLAQGGVLGKYMVFHAAEAVPATSSTVWSVSGRVAIAPGSIGAGTQTYELPIVVPPGVKFTNIQARLYRETSSETATATLYRYTSEGSPTTMATLDATTNGAWHWVSSALDHTTTNSEAYVVEIKLNANSQGAGFGAQAGRIQIQYGMTNYEQTY